MIVLDTNVVSALMCDDPDEVVVTWVNARSPLSIWTTAITVLECRFGIAGLPAGRRKDGLELSFTTLLSNDLAGRILAFGDVDASTRHRSWPAVRPRDDRAISATA